MWLLNYLDVVNTQILLFLNFCMCSLQEYDLFGFCQFLEVPIRNTFIATVTSTQYLTAIPVLHFVAIRVL